MKKVDQSFHLRLPVLQILSPFYAVIEGDFFYYLRQPPQLAKKLLGNIKKE
ncbi:MAG: hypothetical protein Q4A67_04140 [Aerococcus sp.]|nr:hypothetical protein [Aerococcus sp.]